MPYVVVSLAFVVSRAVLAGAGLPFGFSLDWMWLADTADLRDRLAETLWYFHAFPPGMDLLTGLLLKLGGDGAGAATVAAKWLLIGRYRPGRHPYLGSMYVRHWIVCQLSRSLPWDLLESTVRIPCNITIKAW